MLKPKLKKCRKCGGDRVLWANGMCQYCDNIDKFKPLKSSPFPIKQLKAQLKKTRNKKPGNKEFFENMANLYQDMPISFETGKNIGLIGNVNLAHIFPKETYKSLAHEPQNIILLTWEEHTRFDELLGRHDFDKLESEFKSWKKICERVEILLPLCKEQGKLKLKLIEYLSWTI